MDVTLPPNQGAPLPPPPQASTLMPYHRLQRNWAFRWWRPILGTLTVLCGWAIVTIIAVGVSDALHPDPEGTVSWALLLATNLSLAALIPLSMFAGRQLHGMPYGLLSSVDRQLRWRPLFVFVGLAVLAEIALLVVAAALPIELAEEASGPAKDAAAVITVVLLTSALQAAGEEYFFRGYLLQALGTMFRTPWFSVTVSALVFAFFHGVMPWDSLPLFADRFAFGLVAGWLAVRTGGLEASIAIHALNNVVTFVFAALTDGVSDSLGVKTAPWSLVAIDVGKFALFAAFAAWYAHRRKLRTEAPVLVA